MVTLHKVKTKLNITTNRRSLLLLEGEYVSSLKGKSLDFDDLREYVYGDDVRDIDWRASAKHTTPLVKRYVANRKHNILFIVDTSITMKAAAPDLTTKHVLAAEILGLLGFIAVKHNDNVGLAVMNGDDFVRTRYLGGEKHLSRLLETVGASTESNNDVVDVVELLRKSDLTSNTETIMVVIANEAAPSDDLRNLLRKMNRRHDLLWVTVADINPVTIPKQYDVYDVMEPTMIPTVLREQTSLINEIYQDELVRREKLHAFLDGLHVSNTSVTSSAEIIPTLITLLQRRENGHR